MTDLDEARLLEKLRAIEALYARPGTEGERVAAKNARDRILERLGEMADADPPIEHQFSMADMWSRRVFLALLRRYGIRPYRYRRQRYTTVMAKVPERFLDETLWPEFQALSSTLRTYLDEVTNRVVAQVIHEDVSEAGVAEAPKKLASEAQAPSPPEPAPPEPNAKPSAGDTSEAHSAGASSEAQSRRDRNKQKKKRKRR